jgi:hypothetical protein
MSDEADRLAVRLDARRVPAWATVELDRADREVILQRGWPPAVAAADDIALGARTRLATSPDGSEAIVLLEPYTEGRLAASLARFGEGFVAEYLLVGGALDVAARVAREAGFTLSTVSTGPFGPERLVAGTPPWGPHRILAEDRAEPGNPDRPVTIES